jgi:hypothetical protein
VAKAQLSGRALGEHLLDDRELSPERSAIECSCS